MVGGTSKTVPFLQRKQFFPRDGSRETPPHPSGNFKWKDYCPAAFAKLRATFHIDPADYMLSICGAPTHAHTSTALLQACFRPVWGAVVLFVSQCGDCTLS